MQINGLKILTDFLEAQLNIHNISDISNSTEIKISAFVYYL